jgi:hypothetical protein
MPASIRPVGGCRYFQVRDYCKRGPIMFWHLRRRRHSPKHEQLSITTCRVELLHAMDYRGQGVSLLEVTVQRLRSKALLITKAPRRIDFISTAITGLLRPRILGWTGLRCADSRLDPAMSGALQW